jgi:outer membrane immunogenic protein
MRSSICKSVLLVGACIMTTFGAWGQAPRAAKPALSSLDVALTYDAAHANIVPGNNFWLQGGSLQAHYRLWHGLGAVAEIAGLHNANMNGSGVGLDIVTTTFGPRYTWSPAHRRYALFGQFLIGTANGMNSVFPTATGTESSSNGLALQLGGGINIPIARHFDVRALEAGWLHTQLPNTSTDEQNNLRIGAGMVFKF